MYDRLETHFLTSRANFQFSPLHRNAFDDFRKTFALKKSLVCGQHACNGRQQLPTRFLQTWMNLGLGLAVAAMDLRKWKSCPGAKFLLKVSQCCCSVLIYHKILARKMLRVRTGNLETCFEVETNNDPCCAAEPLYRR